MTSMFMGFDPGDRVLHFFLIVMFGAAFLSTAGWAIAWALRWKPAARHLVLHCALIGCLALPAPACISTALGVTLISISIPPSQVAKESTLARIEPQADFLSEADLVSEQKSANRASDIREGGNSREADVDRQKGDRAPLSPATSRAVDEQVESGPSVVASETAASRTRLESPVHHTLGPEATLVSFRAVATGAMFVWAAGVLGMLLRLARDCGRVVQLRGSSRPVQDERFQTLLREVAGHLGMLQVPLLLASSRSVMPMAVSFGRPAVVLPERLLGAVDDVELRDVLAHEMAHLQRRDHLTVLLQGLAGALYWPIVSMHGLNRELQRAREEVCDNVVLASRDPISYGETLLHVAELLVEPRPMGAAVGIIGGQGELERRITRLIDPRRNTMTRINGKMACFVMFLFIAGGAILSATRFAASTEAAETAEGSAAETASQEADLAPPDNPSDPDDPNFAGRFSGRVTGPDGEPLPGARIYITALRRSGWSWLSDDIGPVRAETDADGRFDFDTPDMTYTDVDGLPARRRGLLIAMAEGFAPDWMTTWGKNESAVRSHWDPVKGAELTLQLAADDVPVHGRLLEPDGQPLVGARVQLTGLFVPRGRDLDTHLERITRDSGIFLTPNHHRSLYQTHLIPGLTTDTKTDADGRFTFSGLGRDRLAVLSVSAPHVFDTNLTVMTRVAPVVEASFLNGETLKSIYGADFTLQLQPGRTIRGQVVDRESGEPIPGMSVGPLVNAVVPFDPSLYPYITDREGRFTIAGRSPSRAKETIVAVAGGGLPYQTAWIEIEVEGDAEVVIECPRGIPYRLQVVDEEGRPVEAEVSYVDLHPNPHFSKLRDEVHWPINRAARQADGTYAGFVLPGPGAVLVKTPGRLYRPAMVDPKAFFAAEGVDPSELEDDAFGTTDTLEASVGRYRDTIYRGGTIRQHEYSAVVLVNPAPDAEPLELSATVVRDRPRQVSLVDAEGRPVAETHIRDDRRSTASLRTASFPLTGLHPDRVRRITFFQDDRRLIGFLMARGDSDEPYSVRMQPWGTVTGRIVDQNGNTLSVSGPPRVSLRGAEPNADRGATIGARGRFRFDKLVPGHRYSAEIRLKRGQFWPDVAGTAFENLVLQPGEVRDLGDIRINPSADAESGTKPGN